MAKISHLECSKCGEQVTAEKPRTLCPECAGSLYVRYQMDAVKKSWSRESLAGREATMWRYREVLPDVEPVSLGEGFTPMLKSRRKDWPNVWIKEEGANPTGSFKARGLCMAVTMAKHYGLKKLAIPSAGNAAGALAAYCAAAGIEAHIFVPKDVPLANTVECMAYGAKVTHVDGLISDCAKMIAAKKEQEGWFDISTLKEPYRIEGKKTMGYEVAEQLEWNMPDAIFYPTGGGVGLIGMWKAFEEMEQLGWIGKERPKMVAIQATGCAPIPKAFEAGKSASEMWQNASTDAAGLRVPKAYGDYIILNVLKKSGGTAVAVTDEEMMKAVMDCGREEGLFISPEGAASFAAYEKLLANGFLKPKDRVVLFNTGSGLKYIDVMAKYLGLGKKELPKSRNIGGIIQPA